MDGIDGMDWLNSPASSARSSSELEMMGELFCGETWEGDAGALSGLSLGCCAGTFARAAERRDARVIWGVAASGSVIGTGETSSIGAFGQFRRS